MKDDILGFLAKRRIFAEFSEDPIVPEDDEIVSNIYFQDQFLVIHAGLPQLAPILRQLFDIMNTSIDAYGAYYLYSARLFLVSPQTHFELIDLRYISLVEILPWKIQDYVNWLHPYKNYIDLLKEVLNRPLLIFFWLVVYFVIGLLVFSNIATIYAISLTTFCIVSYPVWGLITTYLNRWYTERAFKKVYPGL